MPSWLVISRLRLPLITRYDLGQEHHLSGGNRTDCEGDHDEPGHGDDDTEDRSTIYTAHRPMWKTKARRIRRRTRRRTRTQVRHSRPQIQLLPGGQQLGFAGAECFHWSTDQLRPPIWRYQKVWQCPPTPASVHWHFNEALRFPEEEGSTVGERRE